MMKPSLQLTLSATACALAMTAFVFVAPSISTKAGGDRSLVPAAAGIELPSTPALPTLLPR